MSEKHPGPLVVEGKLTDAERMKLESNYLRGTIAEDLNDGLTGGFKGDNFLLIRFHGMYQQDDRDIRAERAEQKLEPRHAMLLRCRLPGGVITTKQWQAIDKFAGENTIYGSIRLTNRQTFQFHGILKKNVKPVHQMLHSVGLDALATANDMNRNVLCTSNPYESQLHAEAYEWAKKISEHLLPRTRAYAEIWLDQEKVVHHPAGLIRHRIVKRRVEVTHFPIQTDQIPGVIHRVAENADGADPGSLQKQIHRFHIT